MRKEIITDAAVGQLSEVLSFIGKYLRDAGFSEKLRMRILIAAEEIFVNIAHYAYEKGIGKAQIQFEFDKDAGLATITFTDTGTPFNPLEKTDPDVSVSVDKRSPGGLGIFMVKNIMDDVFYEYSDGKNILRMTKKLSDS